MSASSGIYGGNPAIAATGESRFRDAQLALFRVSVLKQAKWRVLSRAVGDPSGLRALDLGADNGVLSWLFRQRGGHWSSGDLTVETVAAITRTTGEPAFQVRDGTALPFPDATFDRVVVIDLLEHLADDRGLLRELARCVRLGGEVVLNVPHLKAWSVLGPVRRAVGLDDAWHGHRHAGYTAAMLTRMLPPELQLVETLSYSRFFSHLLDTAINGAVRRRTRSAPRSAKGPVLLGTDVPDSDASALARLYPMMRAFTALDALLPWTRGYLLVARLARVAAASSS